MADAATPVSRKDPLLRIGVHEFRTPLSVILGYLRMLLTERAGELTDMQRKMLKEIEKSAGRVHELVDEMAELNKLEARSAPYNRGVLDLGALIAEEIPAVASAAEREVTIRLIDASPPVTVIGDPTRLRKTFNSVMFSCRRELVTSDQLCVALDRITGVHPPAVRVSLTGADRIDEFRRLQESDLDPLVEFRSGLGYRLAIARKEIEGHGGQIFSQTIPGPDPDSPKVLGAMIILPLA